MTTKTPGKQPSIKALQSDSKVLHYTTRIIVVLVALGAAILSFDALTALATAAGIRPEFAWIWAVVIDGFIMVATFATFALKDRGKSKYYAWTTLGVFVTLSILGNAWHAAIEKTAFQLPLQVAVIVTAIPPLALFLAIHLLVIMVSPTHEQKIEHKRELERKERLRKIEEKELERLEKEALVREIRAQAAETKKQVLGTETTEVTPVMADVTAEPVKLAPTPIQAVSDGTKTTKSETEIIAILKDLQAQGSPLPTGKAIADWLGRSERTGQNFLKKFKEENQPQES